MNYKERMLIELIELQDKISLLNKYLTSIAEEVRDEKENRKDELMRSQLTAMLDYRGLLIERLKLELN